MPLTGKFPPAKKAVVQLHTLVYSWMQQQTKGQRMSIGNGSEPQVMEAVDVVVVGGGNAGFTAAHAAAVRGRNVVLLEKGGEDMAGGNSFYTAGATRIAHSGLPDLLDWVEADERHSRTEVPPYSTDEYAADLAKVTEGRNDPELTKVLVEESQPTLRWLN